MRQGARGQRVSIAVAAALLLGLITVIASALVRPAALHSPQRRIGGFPTQEVPPNTAQVPAAAPQSSAPQRAADHPWLAILLGSILIAALILVLSLLTYAVWRVLRERRDVRGEVGAFPAAADVEDTVHEAAVASLDDLHIGTPKDAIVRAWVRLERAATEAGVPVMQHETPSEFVIRVFDALPVARERLVHLAGLYREARFSSHPMSEAARRSAREDLEALVADLRSTRRQPELSGGEQ